MFYTFEVRLEVTNTLVTRDNILHRKRTYLQKKKKGSSIFKHNINSPIRIWYLVTATSVNAFPKSLQVFNLIF